MRPSGKTSATTMRIELAPTSMAATIRERAVDFAGDGLAGAGTGGIFWALRSSVLGLGSWVSRAKLYALSSTF